MTATTAALADRPAPAPVAASTPIAPGDVVVPGAASVCAGFVEHERTRPARHRFRHDVAMIWIDPDHPGELTGRHLLWSSRRRAPVQFRRSDYGLPGDPDSLSDAVRSALADRLGHEPRGSVRMLTQPRTWGWLFNPITVFVAWDDDRDDPVGLVADVTNTPWKERRRYAVPLAGGHGAALRATFDKEMHVSPFLRDAASYELALRGTGTNLELCIDVIDADGPGDAILRTRLVVGDWGSDRRSLTRHVTRQPFATHRVSARIHREAVRLWRKGVPFVQHPRHDADRKGRDR